MHQANKILLILTCITCLMGCLPRSFKIRIDGSPTLNADIQHGALPVQIKFYQLKERDAFMQATFQELWKQDTDALTNTLLGKKTIILLPQKNTTFVMDHKKGCRYIGIVAIFHHPYKNRWRTIKKIYPSLLSTPITIKIKVNSNKILLQ